MITKCVSADDDGFRPSWNWFRDFLQNDRFSKNSSAKDISDLCIMISLGSFSSLSVLIFAPLPRSAMETGFSLITSR